MTRRLLALLVGLLLLSASSAALAQDMEDDGIMPAPVSEEELDAQPEATEAASTPGKADGGTVTYWGDEPLDEVIKGFYISTRFGAQMYIGGYGDHAEPGFMYGFALGYDIVDWLFSMELGAFYSFHGVDVLDANGLPEAGAKVSGDFGALRVPLAFHFRYFRTKRFEATADVVGGIVYNSEAISGFDQNGQVKEEKPLDYFAGARLGVEYYTGLRHFSMGFDVEFDYYMASSTMGLTFSPMLKYTF